MVGWDDDSIGFHSDDGNFFYKVAKEKEAVSLGPPSTDCDTLGCGVLFESDKPNAVYFCRNKIVIGRFPLRSEDSETLFLAVSGGPGFFGAKFPDRFGQSKLRQHLIDSICSGKCHEWDITLLSSLLTFTPGYVKGDASGKKAVEALRKERNDLAHDAHVLARLSLTEEQFQIKWEIVSESLKVLIELLPGDKAAWRMKIDSIAKEEMGKSTLEPLFERVKEDMQRILDDLEDVRDKAGEAMRIAEGAARMSKVAALGAEIEELKSLFNKKGHVDQDRLPRDVVLSNQKRYRLLKQVGRGGMGTVFEAKVIDTDSDDGKLALKICDADASWRAEREADILKKLSDLNHDNIVKFFDSAFEDSRLVIIMELIKGQSLDEWLERRYSDGNSGVTFTETQPIVKQLVQGMSAVHAIDIAHRDLKPANLVFDDVTGKLVIVDLGLSKQHNTNTTVTAANCQLGTLLYMSPEQHEGDVKEISFSSDVWAIGVIWHEMLTSFTPFEPASTPAHADSSTASNRRTLSNLKQAQMINKVMEKGARKLPLLDARNVPSQIIGIIAKCLYFEKKDRYGDAQELFHQIESVFQELENKPAGMESADSVKPFKSWCASEVAELVRSIGSAFADKANQIDANGIDGEYFLAKKKRRRRSFICINDTIWGPR
jgi:serine/threonine protein kinase